MNKGTAIFLCDFTGIMAAPWIVDGYQAILVDPQHGVDSFDGTTRKLAGTIQDKITELSAIVRNENIVFVAGFPPCTDVAVSGAAHFASKAEKDPHNQAKAALVAEQCRMIGGLSGAPWFFENPVSVFSSIFGKPNYSFHPYEYGGYLPEDDNHPDYPGYIAARDAYPKKTCLWTGGGFVMPGKIPVACPAGFSAQHTQLGGKSLKTKNIRSATPRGFAMAVFLANSQLN